MLAAVAIAVVVFITADGKVRFVAPGPLLILALMRNNQSKQSNIKVFVNQDGSDFEFGYYNSRNELVGPFPIDEYTYWCVEQAHAKEGRNYDLYFQINTGGKTVYLKQQVVLRTPPQGWDITPQRFGDGAAIFNCGNLLSLARIVDAGSASEEESER